MSFKVEGLTDWQKALEKLTEQVPKAVDSVLKAEARTVQAIAKKRSPVDTGTLRAGWHVEDGEREHTQIIYNNTAYANHVEYGHRTKSGGFVKGRYMLWLALKDSTRRLSKALNKLLKGTVEHEI